MSASPELTETDAIRAIVARLSRPVPAGGSVIERAAIMAEGADSRAIIRWITDHDGEPEAVAPAAPGRGLHADRATRRSGVDQRPPRRYVLPAGALD